MGGMSGPVEVFPGRLYGAHPLDGELIWVKANQTEHRSEEDERAELWDSGTDRMSMETITVERTWVWDGTRNADNERRFRLADATS